MEFEPAKWDTPVKWEDGFDAQVGLQIDAIDADTATARVPVRDAVRQPFGLVHGGVYAAVAESLASLATAAGVVADGLVPQGLSNNTSFMRPVLEGEVHARAQRRHRGRTTWVWDVDFTDDQGRLCATSRVTIAVRAPRTPGA